MLHLASSKALWENGEVMSGQLNAQNAQRRIDAIDWYHDFDFPGGLKARTKGTGTLSRRALWAFMKEQLDTIEMAGRSVLDVGCWDGYWSFYAAQRGATRILATDDASQNYAGSAGLDLAKELMGSSVEVRKNVSVYDLRSLNETFDVIMCMGVYYHLIDPFFALTELRHCCNPNTVVAIEGDFMRDTVFGLPAHALFDIGHGARCFLPTLSCLRQMINAAYFDVTSEQIHLGTPDQKLYRVFTVCRPLMGCNPLHPVRPPFGLHRYDPRYAGPETAFDNPGWLTFRDFEHELPEDTQPVRSRLALVHDLLPIWARPAARWAWRKFK
jgi:tRNA (mo5U34)-methyltransferase